MSDMISQLISYQTYLYVDSGGRFRPISRVNNIVIRALYKLYALIYSFNAQ